MLIKLAQSGALDGLDAERKRGPTAFTLLEVMIAAGIFFMAIFAILALVSGSIRNARYLQEQQVDPGMLLADLVQTNKLQEGSDSGDFGELFRDYAWRSDITLVSTNGLFKVEYVVYKKSGGPSTESSVSTLVYRPDSPQPGQQPAK
jgi:Tfp pilus assembly protein PilV